MVVETDIHIIVPGHKRKGVITIKFKKTRFVCLNCNHYFGCAKGCNDNKCPICKSNHYVVTTESNITKAQIDGL